jgi:hypothetical protein
MQANSSKVSSAILDTAAAKQYSSNLNLCPSGHRAKRSTTYLCFWRVSIILHERAAALSRFGSARLGRRDKPVGSDWLVSTVACARPSLLNNLVAATSLAFLVAAAGSHVNSRSGRNEEALQAIRLDRVYLLFVVGCTSS